MHTAQILLIVADDLGFNDVGFQTPSFAITKTPNLDYLAHGGVVFTNHHVQPFCSPTRAALQTGRHVLRYGLQNTVIWPQDPWALPLNETFLAENLKDAGYYTAYAGKVSCSNPNRPCLAPALKGLPLHSWLSPWADLFDIAALTYLHDDDMCAVAPWVLQGGAPAHGTRVQ